MVDQHSHLAPLTPRTSSPRRALHRMAVAVAATVALTLMAFTSIASAQARRCAFAHTRLGVASRTALRRAVVCLINRERAAHGLPGLAVSNRLNRSAQGWTNTMVNHRYFSHGADFASRISAVGFDWSNVGENIAAGFQTPASVVRGWMASPGHCQNILSPVYRQIGTGLSHGATMSGAYGTWTQDFGLWMGERPSSGNYGPAEGCPYL